MWQIYMTSAASSQSAYFWHEHTAYTILVSNRCQAVGNFTLHALGDTGIRPRAALSSPLPHCFIGPCPIKPCHLEEGSGSQIGMISSLEVLPLGIMFHFSTLSLLLVS